MKCIRGVGTVRSGLGWRASCVYSFYYVYLAHAASSDGFGGAAVFHLTVWIGKIPGAPRISYSASLKHFYSALSPAACVIAR